MRQSMWAKETNDGSYLDHAAIFALSGPGLRAYIEKITATPWALDDGCGKMAQGFF
jgi:hypothetical protein